jgi:hypothetical protein
MLNRRAPSLNDFKSFKLAKEMRRESADFIGPRSGKTAATRPDIKLQAILSHLNKRFLHKREAFI